MAHGGDPVWTSGTFKQDLLDDPNANFYRSYNFGPLFGDYFQIFGGFKTRELPMPPGMPPLFVRKVVKVPS